MENAKIKVGIIGAGRMGITHYAILNSHPDLEITAVADTTPMVNTIIGKYMGVRTYKSYSALLDRESLDAIILCTPPALNYEILLAANRKGVHVFVEKPGTLSAARATEIAELFDARGLVNQVGYVSRFNDVFGKVKHLIEQGVVGEVIRFRTEMYTRTVIREESGSSWRTTREQGGGATYEIASHAIDLANYFFGRPDAVAGTCLSRVFSKQVEDVVSSSLVYGNGLVGSLYVNWSDASYRKPTAKFEIFGKLGRILADQYGLKVHLGAPNAAHGLREGWTSLSITDLFTSVPFYVRGIEFTAQLYHFVDCVKAGAAAKCRCTFRDAADTLRVIEEMFLDSSQMVKAVNK